MREDVRQISTIGEYQLGNLLSNKLPFLFYYLADANEEEPDHPLLAGIQIFKEESLVAEVSDKAPDTSYPIVLVCRNGQKSQQAAESLAVAGYINIFVVGGGVDALV